MKWQKIVLFMLITGLASCEDLYDPLDPGDQFTGIEKMDEEMILEVDNIISNYMDHYDYISVGLLMDGEIVLTKSYNEDRIGKSDVYASVTKPVTSAVCMQMIAEGLIGSVADPVDNYSEKCSGVLPGQLRV